VNYNTRFVSDAAFAFPEPKTYCDSVIEKYKTLLSVPISVKFIFLTLVVKIMHYEENMFGNHWATVHRCLL
jgi:hypothetical protein